jgi:hypothetical protein
MIESYSLFSMTMTTTCAGGVGVGAARGRRAVLNPTEAQAERSRDQTMSNALEGRTDINPS